jgi:drug/metabolite transporter (DMT)-like permease
MDKKRKLAYLAAISNALIWGAALPLVKPALSHVNPHQFLFLRYLVAAPILLPFLIISLIKNPLSPKQLFRIFIFETLSMIVLYIIYIGLDKTAALQASFFLNTKPIFTILAGVLILKEVEERHELVGLVLAVIGTGLVLSTPIFYQDQLTNTSFSLIGNFIIFSALLLDVVRLMGVKKFYGGINKLTIVSISALLGLIFFSTIGYFTNTLPALSIMDLPSVALPVIYMGTLGTILAFTFQFIAYTYIEASEAALFSYLQPLVYIPLSVIWLKDTLLPTQLIGVIIIALGVFIAEKRQQKIPQKIDVIPQIND